MGVHAVTSLLSTCPGVTVQLTLGPCYAVDEHSRGLNAAQELALLGRGGAGAGVCALSGAAAPRLWSRGLAHSCCRTNPDELHEESCRHRPAEGPMATLCVVVPKRAPPGPPPSTRHTTQPSCRLPRARLGPCPTRISCSLSACPQNTGTLQKTVPRPPLQSASLPRAVPACQPPTPLQSPPPAEPPHLNYTLQKKLSVPGVQAASGSLC